MKKVLITGYKGFIGKNFLEKAPSDWQITTYEWGEEPPRIKGLDWVIHLGAISSTTETDVFKITKQNINSSIEIFEECIKYDVNFQWSSSASVYGNSTTFKETDMCKPLNLYALSKYIFEEYVNKKFPIYSYDGDICNNIKYQGFRYFNVFGPHEEHKGSQASPIHNFTKQAKEDKIIKIFEDSDVFSRDFIHVDKIIDTHIKIMESRENGIWNIGNGISTSFEKVAKTIAKQYDATIEFIDMPKNLKPHYQKYTCADITKLNKTLFEVSKTQLLQDFIIKP